MANYEDPPMIRLAKQLLDVAGGSNIRAGEEVSRTAFSTEEAVQLAQAAALISIAESLFRMDRYAGSGSRYT
jgi:hypothetical protein